MNKTDKIVTKKSVLGFMFMPQFRLMAPAFAHLRPVFIHTLAIMFEQAGLLPKNHVATHYGLVSRGDGALRDVIEDAWAYIRSNGKNADKKISLYQYSLFFSVIFMLILLVASVLTALAVFASSFVTASKAQLFSHPSGLTTDASGIPVYAGLFDDRPLGAGGVAPDLALDVLNKTLRLASHGNGGALQNALGPLLEIYTSGVMFVSYILIFWAITAIVFDTARTGRLGGGRHNVIWTPIRFVFAIGMLIPYSNGFNSGQMIVLKLSEWGSNLASNAWAAYVQGVADNALVVNVAPNNPIDLAVAMARNYTCAVAANTHSARVHNVTTEAALKAFPEAVYRLQEPLVVVGAGPAAAAPNIIVDVTPGSQKSTISWYLSNDINKVFCGGFLIPNPDGADLQNSLAGTNEEIAIANIKKSMRQAHLNGMVFMDVTANEIGCAFGNKTIPDFEDIAVAGSGGGGGLVGCGSYADTVNCTNAGTVKTYNDIGKIDNECLETMIDDYVGAISGGTAAIQGQLNTFVSNSAAGSFIERVKFMGWAGMGMWYHQISTLNVEAVNAVEGGVVSVEPTYSKKSTGDLRKQINLSLKSYDDWWANLETPPLPAAVANGLGAQGDVRAKTASEKDLEGLIKDGGTGKEKADKLLNVFFPADGYFVDKLSRYGDNVYPLAALSDIGETMWDWMAGGFLAVSFLIALLSGVEVTYETPGIIGFFVGTAEGTFDIGNVVLTILEGPLGVLIQSLSGILIMVTLVLIYLVPMIPWLRVTFGVLSWVMTVFEAVVMVPLVAIAHLRTGGEGLTAPMARNAYILWLNLLLRPTLMVAGYVAALLVFNTMTLFVHNTLGGAAIGIDRSDMGVMQRVVYSVMYVAIIYTMANTTFKLIDIFPNATMKWISGPQDESFDDSSVEGMIIAVSGAGSAFGSGVIGAGRTKLRKE